MSVQARLREIVSSSGWDEAWKEQVTPWDAGNAQPPLRDLIQSNRVNWPRNGRALVPGCGKGYDANLIAATLGLQVVGMDISPIAIKAAQEGGHPENVSFRSGDFFALTDEEGFDLVYDYTFFVAIPPSIRTDWGKKMTNLVKPGGYLITLIFPLDPPQDHGPPYFVRPNHYEEVLGSAWEKVLDEIPPLSSPTHKERERIAVWRHL